MKVSPTLLLSPGLPGMTDPQLREAHRQLAEGVNSADARVAKAAGLAKLALTVSNPPTQAQVQAVADKVDALIEALAGG